MNQFNWTHQFACQALFENGATEAAGCLNAGLHEAAVASAKQHAGYSRADLQSHHLHHFLRCLVALTPCAYVASADAAALVPRSPAVLLPGLLAQPDPC